MVLRKISFSALLCVGLLTGCGMNEDVKEIQNVKIAAFNLSFDRSTLAQLNDELNTSPSVQQQLITSYQQNKRALSPYQRTLAQKIIQIRNVAAIIQLNRPDVLVMKEFNNDGTGNDLSGLNGFQKNYLSVAQSLNSIDGGDLLEPIDYPFFETYATNTGLNSGFDLNHDGKVGQMPADAWGFGQYHGQYAFAMMSRYEIDKANTRTFQQFKWKDLPSAENPVITKCGAQDKVPANMTCGDAWYTPDVWAQVPLSSKNHVDAPIFIPTAHGIKTLHVLMSHPTPPVFDTVTRHNYLKNRDEIQFWHEYIQNADFIYDDQGVYGGLAANQHFVILGDLNADPDGGDGDAATIGGLLSHSLVNQNATLGALIPFSQGGAEYTGGKNPNHPHKERITSTFGLRVDHVIPSANLNVVDSGVFWPAEGEQGRLLVNDARIGSGDGKDISSDHRLVWISVDM